MATDPAPGTPRPEAVLREEILADARRRAARVIRHARKDADTVREQARTAAQREKEEALAAARQEAARRRDMILASVAVEAGRARAARVEDMLRSVRDEADRRLTAREGFDHRATVVRLAAEAVAGMAGDAFRVELPAADREALGPGLADAIRDAAGDPGRTVTVSGTDDAAAGPVVYDTAGRQTWDNAPRERLRRNWPALRVRVAVQTGLIGDEAPAGGGTP